MLAIHLLNHEGSPQAAEENREQHLHEHLAWAPPFAHEVVERAARRGLVGRVEGGRLVLRESGRQLAREMMAL
jgi:manganese/zinc/iron transport system permease protein